MGTFTFSWQMGTDPLCPRRRNGSPTDFRIALVEIGEEELNSPAVSACLAEPGKLATGE
jgi:hypothetical protein